MSINSSLVKLADKIDVDGKSTISPEYKNPNNSIEKSIERIADNYNGSGGGTGGGVTVLTATVSDGAAVFPCTAAELFAYMQSGAVVVKCTFTNPEDPSEHTDYAYLLYSAQYFTGTGYEFVSYGFDINCATGSDIPSFSII